MPGRRTPYNHSFSVVTIPAAGLRTAGVTGFAVDRLRRGPNGLLQWFDTAMVVVVTGTISDGTHSFVLEHSDDGSTWTSVPTWHKQGPDLEFTSEDDNASFEQGYIGHKRYLRVVSSVSGAVSGGSYAVTMLINDVESPPVDR